LLQMIGDLLARRTIAVAQSAPHVLPRLAQERQDGLVAFLAPVLGIVALAPPI